MTTTHPSRSVTPARLWVSAVALPGAATGFFFYLSRIVPAPYDGWWFSAGLTAAVIAAIVGPLVCLAYNQRADRLRTEDDLADMACQLRRAQSDLAAVSLTLHGLLGAQAKAVGWVPPPPAAPAPPLYLVRDEHRPEWN